MQRHSPRGQHLNRHSGDPDWSALLFSLYKFDMFFYWFYSSCMSCKWHIHHNSWQSQEGEVSCSTNFCVHWRMEWKAWQQSETNQTIHMGILQTAEWPRDENGCWMMVSSGAFFPIPAFYSPLYFGPYILSPPALVHFDLSTPESQHVVAKQVHFRCCLERMFYDILSFRGFRTGSTR